MASLNQLALDFPVEDALSFDTFVVEPWNGELVTTLAKLAEAEQFYYLWGQPGSGKTHLLQALCNDCESSVYVPLKKLGEHGPQVLEGLEQIDLVCVDDLDCLSGQVAWQEGLFRLFNDIREQGGRLITSACQTPRQLPVELQDLRSRLSWGTIYQLHGLSDAGKAEALRIRAALRGIEMSPEILNYILLRSNRDMQALLHVLETLDQLSLVEKRKVTIPFIRQIMQW